MTDVCLISLIEVVKLSKVAQEPQLLKILPEIPQYNFLCLNIKYALMHSLLSRVVSRDSSDIPLGNTNHRGQICSVNYSCVCVRDNTQYTVFTEQFPIFKNRNGHNGVRQLICIQCFPVMPVCGCVLHLTTQRIISQAENGK